MVMNTTPQTSSFKAKFYSSTPVWNDVESTEQFVQVLIEMQ
jgi:hypothetical protein